jgi:hypothetical protein
MTESDEELERDMALTAAFLEHQARTSQPANPMDSGSDQWRVQGWREQMRD